MNLPPIQSLWIGSDLSNLEKLCVQSFLDHGHEFHLYTYGNVGGIPSGATVKDADEILPESAVYRHAVNSYANFSDWFRYELLAEKGGWWVDMDCVCIKPFDFAEELVFVKQVEVISTFVIRVPPKHELCIQLANMCRDFTKPQPWDTPKHRRLRAKVTQRSQLPSLFIGPTMFMRAVLHFGLQQFAKPYMYFVPIIWQNLHTIFDDTYADGIDFPQATRSIHVGHTAIETEAEFDKNARYSEKSLFEQLKRKHGITNAADASVITSEEVQKSMIASGEHAEVRNKIARLKISRRNWALVLAGLGFVAGAVVGWMAN